MKKTLGIESGAAFLVSALGGRAMNLTRLHILPLAVVGMTACGSMNWSAENSVSRPNPMRCYSAKMCEAMWAAAQDALPKTSGMKLRLVTDSRLETFTETNYGRMQGVVMKRPIGNGNYEVSASFSCLSYPGCQPNAALTDFNALVALALP